MNVRTECLSLLERTPEPGPWHLEWSPVRERLTALIEDPWGLDQAEQNLCGPAAFFAFWLRREPRAVVEYALSLYETGAAAIGGLQVEPKRNSLIDVDYEALRAKGKIRIPAADWMMLGALRDSENVLATFDGDGSDTVAGVTKPSELQRWLDATGCYIAVQEQANLVFTRSLDHALTLEPERDDIALLISARLLDLLIGAAPPDSLFERLRAGFANHWVVLTEPATLEGGKVSLALWSFARIYRGQVSVEVFERDYYGAVIAQRQP